MFLSHLEIKPSKIGNGLFCKIDIPAAAPVFEVTGNIINGDHSLMNDNVIQIADNQYVQSAIGNYINHSCDPNVALHVVGSRAIFHSLYLIKAGTELTFDYSTSSTDSKEEWLLICKCGTAKCRKSISGLQYLDQDKIKEYESKNVIPLFLSQKIK